MNSRTIAAPPAGIEADILGFAFDEAALSGALSRAPQSPSATQAGADLIAAVVNVDLNLGGLAQVLTEGDVATLMLLPVDVAIETYGDAAVRAFIVASNLLRRGCEFGAAKRSWWHPPTFRSFCGMQPRRVEPLHRLFGAAPALFPALRRLAESSRPRPQVACLAATTVLAARPFCGHNAAIALGALNWVLAYDGYAPIARIATAPGAFLRAVRTLVEADGGARGDELLALLARSLLPAAAVRP